MITAIHRIPATAEREGGTAFEYRDAKKKFAILWDSCAGASWRTWLDWRWTIPEDSVSLWSVPEDSEIYEGPGIFGKFAEAAV